MNLLLKEVRHSPMLWLLAVVPLLFAAAKLEPEAHTLHFVLSVLAIVPLATLLSHATESVATKTGDAAAGQPRPDCRAGRISAHRRPGVDCMITSGPNRSVHLQARPRGRCASLRRPVR